MSNLGFSIRPMRRDDARALVEDGRVEDLNEWRVAADILGLRNTTVKDLLTVCVPHARVVAFEDTPLFAFGVGASGVEGVGNAWLFATNKAQRQAPRLQRYFAACMRMLHHQSPTLDAHAIDSNTLHHHWMERLGFERIGPSPWLGARFIHFRRHPQTHVL